MQILHVTDSSEDAEDELAPLVEALAARGVGGLIATVDGGRGPLGWLRRASGLRAALASRRYDVVHAHGARAALAAVSAQRRVPVVAQLRDELHGGSGRTAQWAARLCGHVLVPDPLSAMRVVADDLRVLPIGIDSVRFSPQPRKRACAALRLDPDKIFVAAEPSPVAAEVFERVRRALPDAVLLPLDGHALAERPALLNAADVLLLAAPSRAAPRLVKQALACNTPIVAVRTGDVPRLIARVVRSTIAEGDAAALAASTIALLRGDGRSDGRAREPLINVRRTADELCRYYAELAAPTAARPASHAVALVPPAH
jgi:hypothetical protein